MTFLNVNRDRNVCEAINWLFRNKVQSSDFLYELLDNAIRIPAYIDIFYMYIALPLVAIH